ncbi:dipeptidase [Acidimangrovimonas sediminis]|uniref:dipeptidase n=1 Tax=Acidimangrovimonas sediminis TaxID=2056283 RepID=UPI000C805CBD|nr:membrane dipeptidase [Acidimangrovimonas sediminis]
MTEPANDTPLMIDMLGGALGILTPPASSPLDYGLKLIEGGLSASNLTMALYARDIKPVLNEFFDYQNLFAEAPHRLLHVRTTDDILEARASGRLGVIQGVQGLHFIEDHTSFIQILATLGLRVAALTYNEATQFGAGCLDPIDNGLTLMGRRAVRELNRCGILVDVSHAGERTSLEIAALSDKPVAATHSNARALIDSGRNLTDAQIIAFAETGGVIGISPYSPFCGTDARPTLDDVLRHFRYVADLVGVEHVAIGTDFFPHSKIKWENGTRRMYPEMVGPYVFETLYAEGLAGHADLPNLPAALERGGFSAAEVEAICGGNALRVLKAAWGA